MMLNDPLTSGKLRSVAHTFRSKKMPIPQTKEEECEEVLVGFQKRLLEISHTANFDSKKLLTQIQNEKPNEQPLPQEVQHEIFNQSKSQSKI